LPDEPCNAEEELCNEYYTNDNNNVVICDLSTYRATVEEEQLLASLDDMNIIDIIEDEGLKYVAGYVAYRFKSTYPHLGDETREMPITSSGDWIQFISRGKCTYPSKDIIAAARIMNIEFEKYHGSNLRKNPFIFNELADIVSEKIRSIQLACYFVPCLNTNIHKSPSNQIYESNRKKNNNKKLTKFTNNKV